MDNFNNLEHLFEPAEQVPDAPEEQEQGGEEEPVHNENPPEALGDVGQYGEGDGDEQGFGEGDQQEPRDETQPEPEEEPIEQVMGDDEVENHDHENPPVYEQWEWGYEFWRDGKLDNY